jgi:3-ketosteroid 9alpha-monooxygenase subunit B
VTFLICMAVTFVACLVLMPIALGLARVFGLYVIVHERQCVVFELFGKVRATVDTPGLHCPWLFIGPFAALLPLFGKKYVVDLRLDQTYLRSQAVNSEEGAPMGIGVWCEMFVHDPVGYLYKNADPRGSLLANVSNATVRCLSNMKLDRMLEERHEMSRVVRAEVSEQSLQWGFDVGSVYVRKVHFRDVGMIRQIEQKVVNRLRQVRQPRQHHPLGCRSRGGHRAGQGGCHAPAHRGGRHRQDRRAPRRVRLALRGSRDPAADVGRGARRAGHPEGQGDARAAHGGDGRPADPVVFTRGGSSEERCMFHSLRVASLIEETHDARSVVFEVPPVLAPAFVYRSGQFLTLRLDVGGKPVERCYSLSSAPDSEKIHKVTVKRVAGGPVSTFLNERLKVGDRVDVKGPEGRFVLDKSDGPIVLFAGGSGITPVISILKTALATTPRRVGLLYANRSRISIIFRDELDRLARAYPGRVEVAHRLDDEHGLLDEAAVRAAVGGHRDPSVFVCGPGPFMALVERAAVAAGASPDRLRIERFTLAAPVPSDQTAPAAPASPPLTDGTPEYIDVELRGERHRVPYKKGKTLLQTARDAGLDAPYSCEEGFCGCCASDLLEGRVVMATSDALTEAEKKRGMVLACQSRPLTSRCSFRFVDS